jgi:3-dehydroquinate synthase
MATDRYVVPLKLKRLPDRSYQIMIQPGLIDRIPAMIDHIRGAGKVFVITDATVRRLYGRGLLAALSALRIPAVLIDVPPGEESKNAGVAGGLHTALLEGGVKRDSLVIALGGGVVGDLAGYVAATILRGVRCVQVPTTLLAQVDSSVGGKVGIDHPRGKNLIGAFHQPAAVFIDPVVLRTLPAREFRNGLAEIVKIAAALDTRFFVAIERNARAIASRNTRVVSRMIARAVSLKGAVVMRDEHEAGLRKALNVGHTIGHALETASDYRLKHGEAVSIGLAAESMIATQMGLLRPEDCNRIIRLLVRLGLPVRVPRVWNHAAFASALALDKKGGSGGARFVLPNGIGRCVIGVTVPPERVSVVCGVPL